MKTVKRILLCLTLVALLVGVAFVGTSADESLDHTDILKYYDPEYSEILLDDFFDDGVINGECITTANDTIANRFLVAGEGDKYMNVTFGTVDNNASFGDMFYNATFDVAEDLFIYNFEINATHVAGSTAKCSCGYYAEFDDESAPETCPECELPTTVVKSDAPYLTLYVDSKDYSSPSLTAVPLINFDFASGTVEFYSASTYIPFDFTIEEGKWYKVEIVYEKTEYALTITEVGTANTLTVAEIGASKVIDVKSVKLGSLEAVDNRGAVVKLDDVYIQKGDSYRKTTADELVEVTAKALLDMKNILASADVDRETKVDVIRVYDILVDTYSVLDVVAEDAGAMESVAAIQGSTLRVYADMLKEGTDKIDVRLNYETRLALIEEYAYYAGRVEEYISEDSEADIKATYEAYVNEKNALINAEIASLRLVALVDEIEASGYDFFSEDYNDLKYIYDTVNAELLVDGKYTYNATYPAVVEAANKFIVAKEKYEKNVARASVFVESVAAIKAAETDKDRLSAYATATANYFDNVTFPNVEDALDEYLTYVDLKAIGEKAEEFLAAIGKAAAALNLTSKTELLDSAALLLDEVDENYPGVIEAKAEYNNIRESIAKSYEDANAYIAAVNGLKNLQGDALRAAIQQALVLKEKGNILEIPGVVEANIALDNAKSVFDLIDAYAVKFKAEVAEIATKTTLTERYAAIKAAKATEQFADDTVDGISEAKLTLAAAVAAYEADVNAINGAQTELQENAVSFSIATVNANDIMLKVLTLLKALIG